MIGAMHNNWCIGGICDGIKLKVINLKCQKKKKSTNNY